jgi:putative FmdB family regulatory protein
MPLYEYQCDSCSHRFEKIQKSYTDPPVETCPKCGKGPVRKLISSPAIQFKGTGWYITDYAKKSSADAKQSGSGTNSSDKKSDKSDAGDSKPEKKSDASSSSSSSSGSSAADTAPAKSGKAD